MKAFRFIFIIIFAGSLLVNCGRERKLKLNISGNSEERGRGEGLSVTEQKSVAIFPFYYQGGSSAIQWLKKGIAEMLNSDLNQSVAVRTVSYESVIDHLKQLGLPEDREISQLDIMRIGKRLSANGAVFGSYEIMDSSVVINFKYMDISTGKIEYDKSIRRKGMENLFTMVDELSKDVRNGLRLVQQKETEVDMSLADISTGSLEAFEKYLSGRDKYERFFQREALKDLTEAVQLDSTFASAYIVIALVQFSLGNNRDALVALEKASRYSKRLPVKESLKIDFAEAILNSNWPKVFETFGYLDDFGVDDPFVYQHYAVFHRTQTLDYEAAVKALEKAIELSPENGFAYNELSYIYAFMGQFDKALKINAKYAEMDKGQPNPLDSRAEILRFAGRLDEAVKASNKALAVKPDFFYSVQRLAELYFDMGKLDKSEEYFKRYMEVTEGTQLQLFGLTNIANIHWAKGDYDAAINQFEKLLKGNIFNIGLYRALEGIYEETGRKDKAGEAKARFFEVVKNNEHVMLQNPGMLINASLFLMKNPEYLDELITILNKIDPTKIENAVQANISYILSFLYYASGDIGKSVNMFVHPSTQLNPVYWQGIVRRDWPSFEPELKLLSEALDSDFDPLDYYSQMIDSLSVIGLEKIMKNMQTAMTELYLQAGRKADAEKNLAVTGAPDERYWLVAGPLDMPEGIKTAYQPEGGDGATSPFRVHDKEYNWRRPDDGLQEGYINLNKTWPNANWQLAYCRIDVNSERNRKVYFSISNAGTFVLWVNGKKTVVLNRDNQGILKSAYFPVMLEKGKNRILIKMMKSVGSWGFHFRITENDGSGAAGILFTSPSSAM